MKHNVNKVTIIGCGKVGMTSAYSLVHAGVVNTMILLGRSAESLEGEELDLEHGLSFLHPTEVISTTDYDDIKGSDVVVITAGAAQKEGETRLDLTQKNVKIVEGIMKQVVEHAPNAIVIMVTNPVDILTYRAFEMMGKPRGRVIGTGTILDTARLRFHLSKHLKMSPKSIHAYVLGEHGDHSFPAIHSASVGGEELLSLMEEEEIVAAYTMARDAAYKIIKSKGATYYAIGSVVSNLITTILKDSQSILPVSIPLEDDYGFSEIALSLPCIVGKDGVERVMHPQLSEEEYRQLGECVDALREYI